MDLLPTAFKDTRVLLKFNPRFTAGNVALAGTDILANNVAQQVIDLTTVEMKSRAQDLADYLGDQAYANNGDSSKNIYGLQALVDNGTNAATIGGLSRSTYPTLQSSIINSTILSLAGLRTLYNDIVDAAVVPTRAYTDFPTWALYETLLQPQEKIYKEVNIVPNYKGYSGFDGLMFSGLEIIPDRKCTTGSLYMLNEDFINFYALDTELKGYPNASKVEVASKLFTGNQYNEVGSLGFYWTGFIFTTQQFAFNGFIVLAGNMLTDNPRRHGVQRGIVSV